MWSDDFTGSNIDTTKWSFEKNCSGGGNNELQCYTDSITNAFIDNGVLHLKAIKESVSGPSVNDDSPSYPGASVQRDYSSARLRTKNKGDWKYGRMDIRAKLPQGNGMWPAIWMLPTDWTYGTWPMSGEIDIMEAVNSNAKGGNNVYGTLHYGEAWPANKNTGKNFISPTNVWDEFHTYSVQWEEGEFRFYVDDVHYATQVAGNWYTGSPLGNNNPNVPFDQRFHMILNVAVGGDWPGAPDANTSFPQEMQVDYVHVYECSVDPVKGKGCATNVDPSIVPLKGHKKPSAPETVTASFDVFTDAIDPRWDLGALAWNSGSYQIQSTIVDADIGEASRGKVLNIEYGNTGGVAFIQASGPKDVSSFIGSSYLEFDVKVKNYGTATGLIVKVDCGNPCSSGDISIGKKGDGVWETVKVPLSTFVAGGLNLTKMNTPIVIFPTFSAQNGVVLQLDNVRWVLDNTPPPVSFAPVPLFTMYDNAVAGSLTVNSYNPAGAISASSIADADVARGQVFNVVKTSNAGGNMSFAITSGAKNMSHWSAKGKLKFDVKLNSAAAGAKLLIKMGNGWPGVSDVEISSSLVLGDWVSYEISIADLMARPNSIDGSGKGNINSIVEMIVIEPSAAMNVSFDNIRLEEDAVVVPPATFAPLSLFTIFGDAVANVLAVQSYNPDGVISSSSVTDSDVARGQVFNVVKTGSNGNVFFNISGGAKNLSHWTATGKLIFDVKVNSRAAGAKLWVKMDSGWPKVSDAEVTLGADGVWTTFSIDMADLIDNPNSNPCCGGIIDIAAVTNIFVLEPTAAMDVSVDNVRLEAP